MKYETTVSSCRVPYCKNPREVYAVGESDTISDFCSYHGEEEEGTNEVRAIQNCQHMCSSNCRREGCNCGCGEWHATLEAKFPQETIDV